MKLLQLNVTANWGSTGKIAEGIGLSAINRGWESYIAYGRMVNSSRSQLIKVGNRLDVYAHYAKAKFSDMEGLGSRHSTQRLVRDIDTLSPDIIHLHNIHDHWLNYPVLFDYLEKKNTPVVWTFHDCWAFTGGCSHFENAQCFKWECLDCREQCPLSHRRSASNFRNRLDSFSKIGSRLHIICVSEWLASYVKRSFFNQIGASVSVINNGIDTDNIFKPCETTKKRMILGVSNIWPEYKGLGDFIKLRDLLPSDIEIVLVGLTKKQIDALPEGITGITRTANAGELAELYRTASVFVNPTRNDSFPTVNLESLACGTPVVTYRTGGSPEAVDDKTGIVVEKGDLKNLRNSIMHILDNPSGFKSADCRERAITCFNKNTQYNKYIEFYQSLLPTK